MLRAVLALALVGATHAGFIPTPSWCDPNGNGCFRGFGPGGVGGANNQMQLGAGVLANGEPIWLSDRSVTLRNVPAWMEDLDTIQPYRQVTGKFSFLWSCPNKAPVGCTIYVFQYKCVGCDIQDGSVPALMAAEGWEEFYCAPEFDVLTSPTDFPNLHPFRGYRYFIPKSTTYVLEFHGPVTEYVFSAWDKLGNLVECSRITEPTECNEKTKTQCEWDVDNSECIMRTCRKKFTGPSGGGPGKGTCAARCANEEFP